MKRYIDKFGRAYRMRTSGADGVELIRVVYEKVVFVDDNDEEKTEMMWLDDDSDLKTATYTILATAYTLEED